MSYDGSSQEIINFKSFLQKEKLYFEENYGKRIKYNVTNDDFESLSLLGVGSFGKVFLVKKKNTNQYYAMKVLNKNDLVEREQVEHTLCEKRILECLRFPFAINLKYCYVSKRFLYLILPFIPGGEVFYLLRMLRAFTEDQAKFYGAQIILSLEYLHHLDLIFRDLKLENIIIDSDGYIKLADFGFCKIVKGRTWTLCGTPDYIAPEIILNKGYGKAVDYWSFGVLIYELCAGSAPFTAPDVMHLYEKIVSGRYRIIPQFTRELKDLTKRLLQVHPSRRIGNLKDGVEEIKKHVWFKDIDWLDIINRRTEPPFIPQLKGPDDTRYFHQSTTTSLPTTDIDDTDTDIYEEQFIEF